MNEITLEENFENYYQTAKRLLSEGLEHHDILSEIRIQGANDHTLATLHKKLVLLKRIRIGFSMLLLGSALCLISCLLTLGSSFDSPLYHYILYGLTSVGAALVIYGLYQIMG